MIYTPRRNTGHADDFWSFALATWSARAYLCADGLAFLGELGSVLLAIAGDVDEAAGPAEEAVNGPCDWSLLEKYGCSVCERGGCDD